MTSHEQTTVKQRIEQTPDFYEFAGAWHCNYDGTTGSGATKNEALADAKRFIEIVEQKLDEEARRYAERPAINVAGEEALRRLLKFAEEHSTGGTKVIANFLLSCYHGGRFLFDMSDFRILDRKNFADCLAVLQMDYSPKQEVHCYFDDGGNRFEALAEKYGIKDHLKHFEAEE